MAHLEIIAHRGFSARAPENTLSAVRAALEVGADAVEWDLHVAACGTPVLIHDATLERTTDGTGAVALRTAEELGRLDAGSWFDAEFAGEPVPTLVEALDEVRPFGTTVYAEVKGYRQVEDLDRMARLVRELGMAERTVFISLDFDIVDRLAGQDGTARMGYVVSQAGQFEDAMRRARMLPGRGMVDLSHDLALAHPAMVRVARDRGVDVAVWTVDVIDEADRLLEAGVRRFTTNRVAAMVAWRARRTGVA